MRRQHHLRDGTFFDHIVVGDGVEALHLVLQRARAVSSSTGKAPGPVRRHDPRQQCRPLGRPISRLDGIIGSVSPEGKEK